VLLLVLVLWFSVYRFRHKGLSNGELVTKMRADLKKMLEDDLEAEKVAVKMYQDLVKLAGAEGDVVTVRLAEDILGETEEHAHRLATILEKA